MHAVSGGCGSAVAMSTFYPLDTVRTRLQLENSASSNSEEDSVQQKVLLILLRVFVCIILSLNKFQINLLQHNFKIILICYIPE